MVSRIGMAWHFKIFVFFSGVRECCLWLPPECPERLECPPLELRLLTDNFDFLFRTGLTSNVSWSTSYVLLLSLLDFL